MEAECASVMAGYKERTITKMALERKGCPFGQNSSDGFGEACNIYGMPCNSVGLERGKMGFIKPSNALVRTQPRQQKHSIVCMYGRRVGPERLPRPSHAINNVIL